jgi:hypothetical protein
VESGVSDQQFQALGINHDGATLPHLDSARGFELFERPSNHLTCGSSHRGHLLLCQPVRRLAALARLVLLIEEDFGDTGGDTAE